MTKIDNLLDQRVNLDGVSGKLGVRCGFRYESRTGKGNFQRSGEIYASWWPRVCDEVMRTVFRCFVR